ncbi:MAG: Uma2 family endonuclease [Cytophagia bacterium]|nr:MAG: Uma2 family endonuclease [Cytophagia bacterium]
MEVIEDKNINSIEENQTISTPIDNRKYFIDYEHDKNSTIDYPDSDGELMADSTTQFNWIITIQGGLDSMFKKRTDVFVAGNLLWYPEEGQNNICIAPDVMVAFGRPKGNRGSYKQWVEDDIAPQVVFEIFSKSNSADEMLDKLKFCYQYGVQEFYVYNPLKNTLYGWYRDSNTNKGFVNVLFMQGFVSPLLGIRFEIGTDTIKIYTPENQEFLTFIEQSDALENAIEKQKEALEAEKIAIKIAQKERTEKEKALEIAEEERTEKEKLMAEIEALKTLLQNKFS